MQIRMLRSTVERWAVSLMLNVAANRARIRMRARLLLLGDIGLIIEVMGASHR